MGDLLLLRARHWLAVLLCVGACGDDGAKEESCAELREELEQPAYQQCTLSRDCETLWSCAEQGLTSVSRKAPEDAQDLVERIREECRSSDSDGPVLEAVCRDGLCQMRATGGECGAEDPGFDAGRGMERDAGGPSQPRDAGVDAARPEPQELCSREEDAGGDEDAGTYEALCDSEIWFEGSDGSSCEQAVVIRGASGSVSGILAEYLWLDAHYPGWTRGNPWQSLVVCDNGHHADLLSIVTAEGVELGVYFDIEDFFGT